MTHYSEDDLLLHHYREEERDHTIAQHLALCAGCAQRYQDLVDTLQLLDTAAHVPERREHYGSEVWRQLRPRLDEHTTAGWSSLSRWNGIALAAAAALLIVAGFTTGRFWPSPSTDALPSGLAAVPTGEGEAGRRRVLRLAVAEHLERSDRVLTDVVNARGGDISVEQEWAGDLLSSSRLYRQDAIEADERPIAAVLDETERALLEIVHSPSRVSSDQLDAMNRRIDSAVLLFKVRTLGETLRDGELTPPADRSPLPTPLSHTS